MNTFAPSSLRTSITPSAQRRRTRLISVVLRRDVKWSDLMCVRGVWRASRPTAELARRALALPPKRNRSSSRTWLSGNSVIGSKSASFFFFSLQNCLQVVNPFWNLFHFSAVSQNYPLLPKTFIHSIVPDLLQNLPVESSGHEITDILKWNGTEEGIDEQFMVQSNGPEWVWEEKLTFHRHMMSWVKFIIGAYFAFSFCCSMFFYKLWKSSFNIFLQSNYTVTIDSWQLALISCLFVTVGTKVSLRDLDSSQKYLK